MKRAYLNMALKEKCSVEFAWNKGVSIDLPCSQMADGCIGVLLVFKSKKSARAYSKAHQVAELEIFNESKDK
jgi:hypothetical protein